MTCGLIVSRQRRTGHGPKTVLRHPNTLEVVLVLFKGSHSLGFAVMSGYMPACLSCGYATRAEGRQVTLGELVDALNNSDPDVALLFDTDRRPVIYQEQNGSARITWGMPPPGEPTREFPYLVREWVQILEKSMEGPTVVFGRELPEMPPDTPMRTGFFWEHHIVGIEQTTGRADLLFASAKDWVEDCPSCSHIGPRTPEHLTVGQLTELSETMPCDAPTRLGFGQHPAFVDVHPYFMGRLAIGHSDVPVHKDRDLATGTTTGEMTEALRATAGLLLVGNIPRGFVEALERDEGYVQRSEPLRAQPHTPVWVFPHNDVVHWMVVGAEHVDGETVIHVAEEPDYPDLV